MESKGTSTLPSRQEQALTEWLRMEEGEKVDELDARIKLASEGLSEAAKHLVLQIGDALVCGDIFSIATYKLKGKKVSDAVRVLVRHPVVKQRMAEKDAEKAKDTAKLEEEISALLRRSSDALKAVDGVSATPAASANMPPAQE
jgi:hypothetical protein